MKDIAKDEKYSELIEAIDLFELKDEVVEIRDRQKDRLITDIMRKFVVGNPRVWWLAFKKTPKNFSFDDEFQYKRINNFFDNDEQCYFIIELDSIHIFKASVRNIIRIIGECSFFEYYVLDLGLDKLLCETEHGDLLFL